MTHPATAMDSQQAIFANSENVLEKSAQDEFADPEDSVLVKEAKKIILAPMEYECDHNRVILYNLGIGATEKEVSNDPLLVFRSHMSAIVEMDFRG
jgi:hypothetical protein